MSQGQTFAVGISAHAGDHLMPGPCQADDARLTDATGDPVTTKVDTSRQ